MPQSAARAAAHASAAKDRSSLYEEITNKINDHEHALHAGAIVQPGAQAQPT